MQEETVQKVMEAIEQKKLSPIPRWKFILKYTTLWIFGVFSILSGAVAFSLVLLLVLNEDWVEYKLLHGSFLNALFRMFPFVWGITFVVFLLVAYMAIRHTKHGYRFRLWSIVGVNILLSLILGIVLYVAGMSHWVDSGLGRHMPGYTPVERLREARWFNPEEGRISGEVIDVKVTENTFLLRDLMGNTWYVQVTLAKENNLDEIVVGTTVGVVGEVIEQGVFNARRIKLLPHYEQRPPQGSLRPRDGSGRLKEIPQEMRINE